LKHLVLFSSLESDTLVIDMSIRLQRVFYFAEVVDARLLGAGVVRVQTLVFFRFICKNGVTFAAIDR